MAFGGTSRAEIAALIRRKEYPKAAEKAGMLWRLDRDFISALLLSYASFLAGDRGKAMDAAADARKLAGNDEDRQLASLILASACMGKGNAGEADYCIRSFIREGSFEETYMRLVEAMWRGRPDDIAGLIRKMMGADRKRALTALGALASAIDKSL